MNLNLSASLGVFKLLTRPSLCLPHAAVSTFNDIPIPLDKAFERGGKKPKIEAVVLDKDDCFAYPETNEVYPEYKVDALHIGLSLALERNLPKSLTDTTQQRFDALRAAYPGRRLLIVSNTAGALTYDRTRQLAMDLEAATGVTVLAHQTKKPGCGDEIMAYFRAHPETGITSPGQIAVVGDRLTTDMMLANSMGSWGLWVKDGVVSLKQKSIVSICITSSEISAKCFPNVLAVFEGRA